MASAKRFYPTVALVAAAVVCARPLICDPPDYATERAAMVERLRALKITNERVLAAMRNVPRHLFVAESDRARSYDDVELPVGSGQHCCRPYVVALTAQILDLQPGQKVLQVGVSSGYCTAVLSEMTSQVYVIDSRPEIMNSTRARLRSIGYSSVTWKNGDACKGWTKHAPYDAILVTCATPQVPDNLLQELRDGGRMIVPIGLGPEQTLTSLLKSGGTLSCKKVMTLRVDPMRCTDHSS